MDKLFTIRALWQACPSGLVACRSPRTLEMMTLTVREGHR